MAKWFSKRLDEIVEFNPRETIKKGVIAKKIAMDKLQPFCRDITEFELEPFSGGTKFRNGDTIMARITPCLENGKTAKVNILDDGEVGFGSTEYIVFRAREGVDTDFVYYLISSPLVREPAIKSMVGWKAEGSNGCGSGHNSDGSDVGGTGSHRRYSKIIG